MVLRVRFLGVILDKCLNWKDQIQYVANWQNQQIAYVGILYKVRSSLKDTSQILLHNSLVYFHLTYLPSVT